MGRFRLSSVLLLATACGTTVVGPLESSPPPPRVEAPARAAAPPPPPAAARPVTPPPPPVDPEAEARTRAERERLELEAAWPLHGLAYHYLVQVRARPDGASRIVGYLRRGSRFRTREPLAGTGCARGWSELPGEGYVCRGEGVLIGATPPTFDPLPVPPALEDALPYAYAYVGRAEAPQYWRVPTATEEARAADVMRELAGRLERARGALEAPALASAPDAAVPDAGAAPPGPSPDGAGPEGAVAEGPAPDAEPAEAASEPVVGLEAPPGAVAEGAASLVPVVEAGITLPDFLRMRMESGFYVSVDREENANGRRYFRTIRGAYVPAEAMVVADPPQMRGVVLGGRWRLPIGFVFRRGATALVRELNGTLRNDGELVYHEPLVLEDEIIERRGGRYRMSRRGVVARETALRIAHTIDRPRNIGQDERWIHVDLSEQTLVAYEGDNPVFVTLVSSGREDFASPTGTFRIESKHVSTTMDDTDSLTEAYSIEDVPWTMYFHESYALHAAFWHDHFGRPRSHGCINLSPADARWLFGWTLPELPPGWHGVISSPRRAGSWVHITE